MTMSDSRSISVAVLFLAALLEAGGDAVVRKALHRNTPWARLGLLAAGALVLFAYGYTVNAPAWDFSKLLGLYVVFFFVIAQLMSWIVFNQPPTMAVLVGGTLITAGGCVIAVTV